MDLDAIEPVLQAAVAAARGDDAGVVAGGGRHGRGGEAAGGRRYRLVPKGEGVAATMVAHVSEDAHLPDRLQARRGIRTAEGNLPEGGIPEDVHFPLPDIEVDQVRCVGSRGQRWGQRRGQIGLVVVGHG
jgi:hypothetical protein